MNTVHMLVGIPGSGKSTYCKKELIVKYPEAVYVSSDKTRDENPSLSEPQIWIAIYNKCADAIKNGNDLIFDATSTTPKVRNRFKEELKERGIDISNLSFIAYYFDTDPKECVKRVKVRNTIEGERYLPINIIPEYGEKIIKPTIEEGFSQIIDVNNKK